MVVIGGGIVGMATALRLIEQRPSLKICVLEKEVKLAQHQTGNNSGVIHSGLYYKPNSLKALNCVRGYNMLLDFAQKENIPHELCGKVVIATRPDELPTLETIYERGMANGLTKIKKIKGEEIKQYEPHATGIAGLFVPYTGIIDYEVVTNKYAEKFMQLGGLVFSGEKVIDIKLYHNNAEVITASQKSFQTKLIINCAGLFSDKIAALNKDNLHYKIIPFRGEYYKLREDKTYLVKTLIYPVPDPNFPFLGVHFTKMIGGGVEAGPNAVLAFRREGYKKTDFSLQDTLETLSWAGFRKVAFKYWKTGMGEFYRSFSKAAFTKALQRLLPEIQESDLVDGGAGIRAQACDKVGGLIDDFLIIEDRFVINVGNAPSPAATSSLSIGQTLSEMALKRF
ncbi:MAG: L-2-hydroxyglutarate oxidase [Thermoflexibacteraceae bacterium]